MGDIDRLPMANVSRIVASALPKDASVSKEARVALSACATVFVHYLTELAVQQCDKRKKVTLTPEDILEAVKEAEFDDFDEPLQQALQSFRNQATAAKKSGSANKRQKLDDSVAEQGGENEESMEQSLDQSRDQGNEEPDNDQDDQTAGDDGDVEGTVEIKTGVDQE